MKRYIKSQAEYMSGLSFDFIYDTTHDITHDTSAITYILYDVFHDFGSDIQGGPDFRSVDYSDYPEYADKPVGQCGVDFTWVEPYPAEELIDALSEKLSVIGVTLIGYDFYSID